MLAQYLTIAIFIAFALGFAVVLMFLGFLFGPKKSHDEKTEGFECGFSPFNDARMSFDVRFYLVAILFILFDLEIAFFFPWAVVFADMGMEVFWAMMIFLSLLGIGFVYEWKKGALNWE